MHPAGRRTATALLGALLIGGAAAAPAAALTPVPAQGASVVAQPAPVVAPGPRAVDHTPSAGPAASPATAVPRARRHVSRSPLRPVQRRLAHRVATATR